MTALTPDDLARIEADTKKLIYISDGTSGSDRVGRLITAVPALVAGVRSRDERIAELEAEKAAAESERDGFALAIKALADILPAVVARVTREAKAEALEESATEAENNPPDTQHVNRFKPSNQIWPDWLQARAAEYRKETK